MRSIILPLAALAFASAAVAVAAPSAQGPYVYSHGKCHAKGGQVVLARLCHVPAHCKDPRTHKSVKCGTPGAVPTS
jgi:hypothetical protein